MLYICHALASAASADLCALRPSASAPRPPALGPTLSPSATLPPLAAPRCPLPPLTALRGRFPLPATPRAASPTAAPSATPRLVFPLCHTPR